LFQSSAFNQTMNDKTGKKQSNKNVTFVEEVKRKASDDTISHRFTQNFDMNNILLMKKETIFRSTKVRKQTSKSDDCTQQNSFSGETYEGKDDKLKKNRMSAKRSRAKKKAYIEHLQKVYLHTIEELDRQKSKCVPFDGHVSFDTLHQKEKEYFEIQNEKHRSLVSDLKEKQILNEHSRMQHAIVFDLFRKMIKNLIPLELKHMVRRMIKFKDITCFESLDELMDIIIYNQIAVEEVNNSYHPTNPHTDNALPIKYFYFLEQLKTLTIKYREFLFEVKKLET